MSENNETNPGKTGFLEKILNKFKKTANDVSEKVEKTVADAKESSIGEKISDVADNIGDKMKDVINDVKESDIVDKISDAKDAFIDKTKSMGGEAANFCSSKLKNAIGKMDFEKTLNSLKEKQQSSGKDLSKVINFVEKLQNIKNN